MKPQPAIEKEYQIIKRTAELWFCCPFFCAVGEGAAMFSVFFMLTCSEEGSKHNFLNGLNLN